MVGVEKMSWQPLHQIFNEAYLNCAMRIIPVVGIIWEGTNRYESLMSGELDLSSPPFDINTKTDAMFSIDRLSWVCEV